MAKYYCDYQPTINRHPSHVPRMKCYIPLTGVVELIQLLSRGPSKFAPERGNTGLYRTVLGHSVLVMISSCIVASFFQ